jgi:hypothetical protein
MPVLHPCYELLGEDFSWSNKSPAVASDIEIVHPSSRESDREPSSAKVFVLIPPDNLRETAQREEFLACSRQWKRETMTTSSLTDVATHPSYQRIIGLGPEVLPLVFADLRETGAPWFWALRALTGKNPVPADHRGNMKLTTHDWLEWAREHGY